MKARVASLRKALPALGAAVVIAVAAVVWHFLPTYTQVYAPFDVHGTSGTTVTGRNLSARVFGARVTPNVKAPSVVGSGGRVAAAGVWVVVDATVSTMRDSALPKADLLVAGNTYTPSDRFLTETLGGLADPGIPQIGTWTFDVNPKVVDDDAATPFALRLWVSDGRLDSRLVIDIKKDDVSREQLVSLTHPEIG
ncbi:MAG TPA: hypothetical protein VFB19_14675 [Mycobacterium sp.]|nr:hypothetical protein [Mycobacterium sp.]